jgi:hypothetical protein
MASTRSKTFPRVVNCCFIVFSMCFDSGRYAFHHLAHYISPDDSNRVRIHTSGRVAPGIILVLSGDSVSTNGTRLKSRTFAVGWVGFLLLDIPVGRCLGNQVLRSNPGFVPGHPSAAFSIAGLSSCGTDTPFGLPSSSNRMGSPVFKRTTATGR